MRRQCAIAGADENKDTVQKVSARTRRQQYRLAAKSRTSTTLWQLRSNSSWRKSQTRNSTSNQPYLNQCRARTLVEQ